MNAQGCLTPYNPRDCSQPGSFVHGTFWARILEWVAISYSRGSSQHRDRTCISCVSCIGRWILYNCASWETQTCNTWPFTMKLVVNLIYERGIFFHLQWIRLLSIVMAFQMLRWWKQCHVPTDLLSFLEIISTISPLPPMELNARLPSTFLLDSIWKDTALLLLLLNINQFPCFQ